MVELAVYGRKIRTVHQQRVNILNGSQHPPSLSRLVSIGADVSKSFSCVHKLKTADGKKILFPDYELNVTQNQPYLAMAIRTEFLTLLLILREQIKSTNQPKYFVNVF